ncbi:uncharacterized protein LOC128034046 [Gossypium raimondii]|uniref:uncharacterized protein LOC128034046 n=1 Tax=Gossypium raimondii TaxID=29730 RepID=UPI00227D037A|nr:uncharacterized protein LOC128034046 [Gossypium raimondii]
MSQKDLNLRQCRWLKLLKDYDLIIDYHLGKGNVVVDALSRKSMFSLRAWNTRLTLIDDGMILAELKSRPTFLQQICEAQKYDNVLIVKRKQIEVTPDSDLHVGSDDTLYFKGKIFVPRKSDLIQKILQEAHSSSFSIHPDSNKMYGDLKQLYGWPSVN